MGHFLPFWGCCDQHLGLPTVADSVCPLWETLPLLVLHSDPRCGGQMTRLFCSFHLTHNYTPLSSPFLVCVQQYLNHEGRKTPAQLSTLQWKLRESDKLPPSHSNCCGKAHSLKLCLKHYWFSHSFWSHRTRSGTCSAMLLPEQGRLGSSQTAPCHRTSF